MGATNFEASVSLEELKTWCKEPGFASAYTHLVNRATDEYGSDPYNGTISTTNGYSIADTDIHTMEQCYQLSEELLDNYQKWEAAGALAYGDVPYGKTRKITKTVTLPPEFFNFYPQQFSTSMDELLAAYLKPGEKVVESKILDDVSKWKITTTKAIGSPRKVFVGPGVSAPTMAQALKQAKEKLTNNNTYQSDIVISQQVVYDAPAKVSRERTSRKIKVEAIVGVPQGKPVLKGYFFFGWAAM